MRFSRKEREQAQKNWRMWKKGKQWLCGAALFFTVVSSPGMLVLADEVNAGDSTEVIAGEETPPLSEESTENEVEGATEEDGTSSAEVIVSNQQEENITENNETKIDEGKKERPKRYWVFTGSKAIKDIFPDPKLAAEVARVKNKTVDSVITQNELRIGRLDLNGKGITNLSGIEYLLALNTIDISNLSVDISPLSAVETLTTITADNCEISDLSPLAGLVKLSTLSFNNNQISDLSPLAGLADLARLEFNNNQISDLSPLAALPRPKLSTLKFNNNQISDLSPLAGLSRIQFVELNNNQISDIRPIVSNSNRISTLNLNYNQISDISSLAGKTQYKYVNMANNQISDPSPLAALRESVDTSGYLIDLVGQRITLPTKKWSNLISTPHIVKGFTGNLYGSINISNEGRHEDGEVKWTGLLNVNQEVTYSWNNTDYTPSTGTIAERGIAFTGTVTLGIEPFEVKILVDTDGNSQTTSDQ
ncbi:TPA: leucine-rich repeat domain-containing protein, partial [Listeria monocytogenes]|nr:leucine-rich repeat domain-containing protein [Listeria monocytogenes]